MVTRVIDVRLAEILPSRWQPRTQFDGDSLWELAQSIAEIGLINPVVAFREPGRAKYELVAGERRARAAVGLALATEDGQTLEGCVRHLADVGLHGISEEERILLLAQGDTIQARVENSADIPRLHRIAVMENIEREDLTPVDEARALQGLMDAYGWTQRKLAAEIGRSQGFVSQRVSLLGLPAVAQAALNTRVINATHARAIASVPERLQEAVATYVVESVQLEDSPSTTRQVSNLAGQVRRFVDPERWLLDPETVCTPRELNRLRMLVHAAVGEHWEAGEVMSLREDRVAGKSPLRLVRDGADYTRALRVLAGSTGEVPTPMDLGMSCESCRLGVFPVDAGHLEVLCPRWNGVEMDGCESWIGPGDPMVLPVSSYQLRHLFEELGVVFSEGSVGQWEWSYLTDEALYAEAVEAAVKLDAKKEQEREAKREQGHLAEIYRYVDWQTAICHVPDLLHFQAHACAKCKNHAPLLRQEDLPPCQFAQDPLTSRWGDQSSRAPQFGFLVNEAGQVLPRCEMFAYRDVPRMQGHPADTRLPARARVLEWIRAVGKGSEMYRYYALWGVLSWLPYPRTKKQDPGQLRRWLKQHWEEIGDPAMAGLVDVALSEARWMKDHKHKMVLLNPVTGEDERWVALGFRTVLDGAAPMSWPQGWPTPWVKDEEEQGEGATG